MRTSRLLALLLAAACLVPTSARRAQAGALEPFLARLAERARRGGPAAAPAQGLQPAPAGRRALLAWDETQAAQGRARALVTAAPGVDAASLEQAARAIDPSLVWEGASGSLAQVTASFASLARLAAIPGVACVGRPPRAIPLAEVQSEGLDSMRVPEFRATGYSGREARVGVIDLGFAGYESLLGTELPFDVVARSFYRSPSGNGDITGDGENHGTACAELVADVAPGARLYLANVESPVDLKAAVDWMIEEKVSVISHSVGWYFGSMDGRGPINDVAESAAKAGIVWVNAAGNEAERHTWTIAADQDGDGVLEFDGAGDETLDFSIRFDHPDLTLALLWDRWPLSGDLGLQIDIVDAGGTVLASSDAEFAGYPYAFRYVSWRSESPPQAVYARVRRERGSLEGVTMHVFRIGSGTRMDEHMRTDRSLLVPADTPSVIAVGAVDWRTESLDSYSSRGAEDAAEPKPEIVAPVGVSTKTYGRSGFRGTSAAAPHVSGAAALLASSGPHGAMNDLLWDREEIRLLLARAAKPSAIVPLRWGIVRMPVPETLRSPARGPVLFANPFEREARWLSPCDAVEIYDVRGRRVARAGAHGWDGRNDGGAPLPPGIYWARCPESGGVTRIVKLGSGGGAP
ncbi:MAG: S8 family serine peptidase [Candidatus Eisenbacteria bacterium]